MVRVRLAEVVDIDAMLELGKEFHGQSPYHNIPFSPRATAQTLLQWINHPQAAVFVADDEGEVIGACCVVKSLFYFAETHSYATEMFWFVTESRRDEGIGHMLRDAMEQWATVAGCVFMTIVTFGDEAVENYSPIETSHARRLH